jgi:hypothetical protein
LRSFQRIVVEDEFAGTTRVITREIGHGAALEGSAIEVSDVSILQDGRRTSQWLMYLSHVDRGSELASEIVVALRIEADGNGAKQLVAPAHLAGQDASANQFHLFFPTRIATHLPMLLHAYFRVDAGRKGFAGDAKDRNDRLLLALGDVAVKAIEHVAAGGGQWAIESGGLPELFAATKGDSDDELAKKFRLSLLDRLDRVAWVYARGLNGRAIVRPIDLLADDRGRLRELLDSAFVAAYPIGRLGRYLPDPALGSAGLAFVAARGASARNEAHGLTAQTLAALLEPHGLPLWDEMPSNMDSGFRSVLELLEAFASIDPVEAEEVIASLSGNERASIIPIVVDSPVQRALRSPPPASQPGRAIEGGAILSRLRSDERSQIAAPDSLEIAFLADGVLTTQLLNGVAARLGIREYTTDSVLDAVAGLEVTDANAQPILKFVWDLLLREGQSAFGLEAVMADLDQFHPGRFHWVRHAAVGRTEAEVRRAKGLSRLLIPTSAGVWRPAVGLVVGASWADWLGSHTWAMAEETRKTRVAAYRDLELLAPAESIVVGPDLLRDVLPWDGDVQDWDDSTDEVSREEVHVSLIFAFLLRLGVWEIPPIESIRNLADRSLEERDDWRDLPERAAHLRRAQATPGGFNTYGHLNVHIAEDHRMLWPLGPAPEFVRALSRGVDFYQECLRLKLFCPACRRHKRREDNDGEPPSLLSFQLEMQAWTPITLSGLSAGVVLPIDAWHEPEAPDATRMHSSPLQFVPLLARDFDPGLARLAKIVSIQEAGSGRLGRLMDRLRQDFDSGLGDSMRAGTERGQAFISLHRQIYDRLHQISPAAAVALAQKTGVLATRAARLEYLGPLDAHHDDGNNAQYKSAFARGQLSFVVLKRDQSQVARSLGVPTFRVEASRSESAGTDVTDRVRVFVHDRAAEFLALLCYHSVAGPNLELGSRNFTDRAQRLAALKVIQVPGLVIRLTVAGTDITAEVGAGGDEGVFLDAANTIAPVLYHDFVGENWERRLRRAIGPHVAALLENDSYADAFRLLLETEEGRATFLLDHGVSEDDLEAVAAYLRAGTEAARSARQRWQNAVIIALGLESTSDLKTEVIYDLLSSAMPHLDRSVIDVLLAMDPSIDPRLDASAAGALAQLEFLGVDLEAFDRVLRSSGDSGLQIAVAERELSEWRRSHGREVVAVLIRGGWDKARAQKAPDLWRSQLKHFNRIAIQPREYLWPVINDLVTLGVTAEAEKLADPQRASEYLASLVGETPQSLADQYDTSQHGTSNQFQQDRMAEWRRALRPVVVAARTIPGEPAYLIREMGELVTIELAQFDELATLTAGMGALVGASTDADVRIRTVLRGYTRLATPRFEDLAPGLRDLFPQGHLERVRTVLEKGVRSSVDEIRRTIRELKDATVAPVFLGQSQPRPSAGKSSGGKIAISNAPRRHDGEAQERSGRDAEKWVVASVVDNLLSLSPVALRDALEEMIGVLTAGFSGARVDALVRRAREALVSDPTDDDDAVEALRTFVHVSRTSDQFGFDVIGYLQLQAGGSWSPALLEVKSSRDRTFKVSDTEWRRATNDDIRSRYAFCIVLRGGATTPKAIELLLDPADRLAKGQLSRDTDVWLFSYRPGDA